MLVGVRGYRHPNGLPVGELEGSNYFGEQYVASQIKVIGSCNSAILPLGIHPQGTHRAPYESICKVYCSTCVAGESWKPPGVCLGELQ